MAFDANSFHFLPWGWLDWLFGPGTGKDEPVRFTDDVLHFLTQPISYRFRDQAYIYIIIKCIELLETTYDQQYSFDFIISSDPPASNYNPQVRKRTPSEVVSTTVPYGRQNREPVLYGYTFTSLNTLAQNKENLRSFVSAQRERGDDDVVYQSPENMDTGTQPR
jgi:hypothetical protein